MKEIKVEKVKVKDLKRGFGNPRKIQKKKVEELEDSLEMFGDFGLVLIDEHNNVIGGNQRVSVLREKNPETEVLCKRLCGYTEAELRAINIKDNTHAGEWDLDLLADWTADLNVDLGLDLKDKDVNDRKIAKMEALAFEKYDYVLLVCRNELDYNDLIRKLGIEGAKVYIGEKKKIKGRAVWYDEVSDRILTQADARKLKNER